MNTQETILQLEELKLRGMAECYKALQSMSENQRPSLDTFIARLAESERQYRNRKRTEMYLKTSKLRYNAVLEDVKSLSESINIPTIHWVTIHSFGMHICKIRIRIVPIIVFYIYSSPFSNKITIFIYL